MNVDVPLITEIQHHADRIRNVCVLAHVDHGKTTLSDHLIASNGLIHPRLAGELRYMDSKEDEQARGITMKSSSISLLYVPGACTRPGGPAAVSAAEKVSAGVLVNLIDSPGHVDFCSEVSTAARLSDGALVVVDAVEGVCIQTHAVLRQAWEEKVRMCLVLNKLDRLVMELRLTPLEAYERMQSIIAHVNMIVSSFQSERFISEADSVLAHEGARADGAEGAAAEEETQEEEEEEDDQGEFSPEKGNVAFCSAHDGWAFRLGQFAEMYAAKMGCNPASLLRALWGDFAYQPKTKRIVRIKADQRGKVKPLFVQLALEPLWKAYAVCDSPDSHTTTLSRMVQSLGLGGVTDRDLRHADARQALRGVLRAWLPLSEAVLGMAAEHLPSPRAAAPERLPRLLPPRAAALQGLPLSPELHASLEAIDAALASCDPSEDAPAVVYVSKMVAVPASAVPRAAGQPPPASPSQEQFLAFGRVFSGVVRLGQTVHVLPSIYNPADPASVRQEATITGCYLMMGRGLELLPHVPAGNVLALAGLDIAILKNATVASTPLCRPLAPMLFQSAPIVRVAVEPARPGDMQALAEGLRLLHRADPLVQVSVQDNGEHVLCAAGEVHLETCIKDLRERFAKVELIVSPPLVAFRETVNCPGEAAEGGGVPAAAGSSSGGSVVEVATASGACSIRVRALPVPAALTSVLDKNEDVLRSALAGQAGRNGELPSELSLHAQQQLVEASGGVAVEATNGQAAGPGAVTGSSGSLGELAGQLTKLAAEQDEGSDMQEMLLRIRALGPKRCGPNFLLSALPGGAPAADTATAAAATSLWDVPRDKVVKLAKQQPGRGQPAFASGSAPPGKVTAQEEQAAQDEAAAAFAELQIPVNLGLPEASQRLGLCPVSPSVDASTGIAAAEVDQLAARLQGVSLQDAAAPGDAASTARYLQHSIESGVAAGFQMATAAGPLCDEPLWGVAFELEARLNLTSSSGVGGGEEGGSYSELPGAVALGEDVYGPFAGQVTSAVRQALRRAVTEAGPRLAEAAFLCEISTSSEGLSAVYAVLGRRRARVLREELREGSDLFTIHAYLPAEASFGFADELRRRSSGAAAAALMLSHWERLQVDPFFTPVTEEEREEFGEEGQGVGAPNLARRLIDAVRRRKGLPVEEKVVEVATKQRTRARKV